MSLAYGLELSAGVYSISQFGSLVCSLKFRDNGTDLWAFAHQLGSELLLSIHGGMELGSELSKLRNHSQWWKCKVVAGMEMESIEASGDV